MGLLTSPQALQSALQAICLNNLLVVYLLYNTFRLFSPVGLPGELGLKRTGEEAAEFALLHLRAQTALHSKED